jgi:hypothetical protein
MWDDDEDFDEADIDVCVCCGRYYGLTNTIVSLWNDRPYPETSGSTMPQFCYRCMKEHYGHREDDHDVN